MTVDMAALDDHGPVSLGLRDSCRIRVCQGCCCGSATKHPGLDHEKVVERLRLLTRAHAEVDVVPCLLACDRSSVVVINPAPSARRRGAGAVWVGRVNDDRVADSVAEWVARGGPGVTEPPERLRALLVDAGLRPPPPKRGLSEVETTRSIQLEPSRLIRSVERSES